MKIPLSQLPHPQELAHMLHAAGEDFVALLESGQGYVDRSRYTLVAWGIEEEYLTYGVELYDTLDGAYRSIKQYPSPLGGDVVIGAVMYDAVAYIEPLLLKYNRVERELPVAFFIKPAGYILYDKLLGRACLHGDMPKTRGSKLGDMSIEGPLDQVDRAKFVKWVVEAKERIRAGEIFQVVLSRFEEFRARGDLFRLYVNLVNLNPSPYMYFLKWRDVYIIGASPELLFKTSGDRVETHPIAGTRPRGSTEEEDIRLEEEMLRDEKELAEHVMLVDLARNDLGRVCRPGTVKVDELYAVEKYSRVQHIVSRVSCIMAHRYTPVDVLWATHPAGTVSGAPKVRAMEIIAEFEEKPRGFYAGALGFFSPNLSEFAIAIRTAIVKNQTLRIQAGAGVVYDSNPENEYRETEAKLRALKEALWT